MITIRQGVPADLPFIHDLVRELAIYEHAEDAFTATLDTYRKDFEAEVFEFIVAETDGEVIGMALYYLTYSTWKGKMLYLEDFVVKEAYRRSGAGQLIFDAFLEQARQKECVLTKWQVLDWNEPAIKFYKKNDADLENEWINCKIFVK